MEDQLVAFLEYLQEEYRYSANTTAAYRNDLNQFLTYLRDTSGSSISDWSQVNAEKIDEYVDYMKEQPYASSSIARKVAAVKSFFNYLFARSILEKNPTNKIESPKVKKRLPKVLDVEDVKKLLHAPAEKSTPKHLRDTALLTMLYSTGMRVTEIVSLRMEDVDFEKELLYCPGKDGRVRELPLDEETKSILETYLEKGRPFLAKDRNSKEDAVFLNHRGQQLTRQGLWLIIKAYAKEANLKEDVTPHTLRHSFAAHKIDGGIDLREVQRLLGHANISTTQIYTQLDKTEE